jgi:hypothetical protein
MMLGSDTEMKRMSSHLQLESRQGLKPAWLLISLSNDTKCKGDYMEVSSSARIK